MATQPLPPNDDLIVGLFELGSALNGRSIQYALIGGLATGYRSRPRFTRDIDFLLDIPQIVLPSLLDDLQTRGFTIDVESTIRRWTQEHMAVLRFRGVRVDWLKPVLPCMRHVIEKGETEQWAGSAIRIAAAEGLILLKLLAFRDQDRMDIQSLLAANRGSLDLDWVRSEWQTVAELNDPRMKWLEEMITQFYRVPPFASSQ